jgi:hypothetical protein
MTADGRPFSQHARAQNISSEGALLAGIENELKVGDIVGVQCEEKKTRCTVMWVMNTGPIKKNQVGIKLLAGQECPWKAYLPVHGATPTILDSNRRRWPRHKISFPIELRDERVQTPMRISATDVSGNGCYVETIMPLPIGTVLRVEFYLENQRMTITAVIRTCDPGVGNGTNHRHAHREQRTSGKPTWMESILEWESPLLSRKASLVKTQADNVA